MRFVRAVVEDLARSGNPTESDDFAHTGILLSHQLSGAVRFCLRCEPLDGASAVHLHAWNDAVLNLVACEPDHRAAMLGRLLVLAEAGKLPKEKKR